MDSRPEFNRLGWRNAYRSLRYRYEEAVIPILYRNVYTDMEMCPNTASWPLLTAIYFKEKSDSEIDQ